MGRFRGITVSKGSRLDDVITGSEGRDLVFAKGGDDVIETGGGDDIVFAGSGNDVIFAGAGDDLVFAGAGDDIVFAGSGWDVVYGGSGNDEIFGESGNDLLFGGRGDDFLSGGAERDLIFGSLGNDTLEGGTGNDILIGGSGFDNAVFQASLFEFEFYDLGFFGFYVLHDGDLGLDALFSVEQLQFSDFSVFIDGTNNGPFAVDDEVATNADQLLSIDISTLLGNDFDFEGDAFELTAVESVSAAGGIITLDGGVVTYDTNGAFDGLRFGDTATDTFTYTITDANGGIGTATVTITVTGQNRVFIGGAGDDVLIGSIGDDLIDGQAGNDTLIGGVGADTLVGGEGIDRASYATAESGVTIDLTDATGLSNTGDALGDTFSSIEEYELSDFNDSFLFGDLLSNILVDGGAGDDVLTAAPTGTGFASTSNNTFLGGEGNDLIREVNLGTFFFFRGQNHTYDGGAGNDTIELETVQSNATIIGGDGDDTITAFSLSGGSIDAGAGADVIFVEALSGTSIDLGAGNDVISVGTTAQPSSVSGGDGNDMIDLSQARIFVDLANVQLFGGAGDDTILGAGTTSFVGGTLFDGGDGNDFLASNGRDDTLLGGNGNDTLILYFNGTATGGAGSDIFGLRLDFFTLNNVILDFDALDADEKIDVSGVLDIEDFDDLLANHLSQVGDDVILSGIASDEGVVRQLVTLQNVDIADLDATDFIF